jgi:hypothetical protein
MPQHPGDRRQKSATRPAEVAIVTHKKARMTELHGNNRARAALELMPALHSTTSPMRDGGTGRGGPPSDAPTGARMWKEVPHAEDRKHRAEGR